MTKTLKLEPYQLVVVQHAGWSHVGQTISRPTPEGTIMVRLVPDDPTTMVELPLDKLTQATGKYRWVQYATVSGAFDFPIDMLRYDACAPANFTIEEDERGKITTTLKEGYTELIVGRAVENKNKLWTTERWSSFCWGLKPLRTLPLVVNFSK